MKPHQTKPPAEARALRDHPALKPGLHVRNRHRNRYDFPALIGSSPELAAFVAPNAWGDASIDFVDPAAVKALNRAILKHFYGIAEWDVPAGYLCPPIPGRADYLHHVADLLAQSNRGVIPGGDEVWVLDIGVGANCVYPIIGHAEYGWRFLGTDIDREALAAAQAIADANPDLGEALLLRHQPNAGNVLRGVVLADEEFDLTICNPPFHASLDEAQEGSRRKWRNLGKGGDAETPSLNFGGQGAELWCEGGEVGFLRRLIKESAQLNTGCLWFTALVSKEGNLPLVMAALSQAGVRQQRVIDMAQGQKKSRLVAWSFLDPDAHAEWAARRWGAAD